MEASVASRGSPADVQETGWVFNTLKLNDPRNRPWFVAAREGNGSGRW